MNMKIVAGGVLLLAILAGGYFYMSPGGMGGVKIFSGNSDTGTQATGNVDDLVASVITAAEAEGTVVANDDGDFSVVEEQTMGITSGNDIYVQGEF